MTPTMPTPSVMNGSSAISRSAERTWREARPASSRPAATAATENPMNSRKAIGAMTHHRPARSCARSRTDPPTTTEASVATVESTVMTSPRTWVPPLSCTGLRTARMVSTVAPDSVAEPSTTTRVLTSPAMVATPPVTRTTSAWSPAGIVASPWVEMTIRPVCGIDGSAASTAGAATRDAPRKSPTRRTSRLMMVPPSGRPARGGTWSA